MRNNVDKVNKNQDKGREIKKTDIQKQNPVKIESTNLNKNHSNSTTTTQNDNTKSKHFIKDHPKEILISVVIPLFNEEESLPELALQIEDELSRLVKDRWEVIFIDDGSTDNSYNIIKTIHQRNRKFRAVRFRRNYGKAAALSVGFATAKGVIVVTMDADLQDDPAEIKNLVHKIKEGFDLVSGWKKKRKDPITKTVPSKFFNLITSIFTGLKLHDYNCGLKAYRREVAKNLQIYGEMHRYIPALAHLEGFKVTEIPVIHHPRRFGKSKYGFSRLFKGFFDLLTMLFTTRYFKRPLHFFGAIGLLFSISGLAIDIYLLVEWILGKTALSNRPLALLGIALIIVGVQLISLGLIGEMIVKNSLEKVKYNIKERI